MLRLDKSSRGFHGIIFHDFWSGCPAQTSAPRNAAAYRALPAERCTFSYWNRPLLPARSENWDDWKKPPKERTGGIENAKFPLRLGDRRKRVARTCFVGPRPSDSVDQKSRRPWKTGLRYLLPYTLSATSTGGNAINLDFNYFSNGSPQTITNNLNSDRTVSFTYDNLNRISSAKSQATSGTYCWGQNIPTDGTGYDRYGNLLKINTSQCSTPGLNLSVNAYNQYTAYIYDNSGNMLTDGTNAYTWNGEGMMKTAAGVTYTYDGDGKRVEKSNGTYYWFSPDGTPLAETNASGSTLNEYIYLNGARMARHDATTNVYYYFSDQIGTAQAITTAAGTVCYDSNKTPFGYEMAYTSTCAQHYMFAGMERDAETGNDHTWYRNYEQNLGRWMSPDPLAGDVSNPQSLDRYTYVLNNPTSHFDPLGLDCVQGAQCVQVTAPPDPVPPDPDPEMNCNGHNFDCLPGFGQWGWWLDGPWNSPRNYRGLYPEPDPNAPNNPAAPPPCQAKILNATNNQFGTNYTDANVNSTFQHSTGAPPGQGTLNLNIFGSTTGVSTGYYPVHWWTYAIGYGPTLHAVSRPGGHGGLDSQQTLQFGPNQATFHIDSGYVYNPFGAFFHWLLNMTKAGGYPAC